MEGVCAQHGLGCDVGGSQNAFCWDTNIHTHLYIFFHVSNIVNPNQLKASTSSRVPSSSSSSTYTTHVRYAIAYSSASRGRRIPPSRPNSAIVSSPSSSWAADPRAANS